ncbi:MAG: Gfo/Idh/MocA family oxidoreductase, partial [Chloroflexota bacterium]|nr:Gfo/Idh/MocA family oxidoreductase [Chloroflexota bacterium]
SGWYVGAAAYDPTWRSRREDAGGGALLDNGYHNLYTAEAMLQSPITQVSARVGTHVREQDVDDTAALMLGHASGATSIVLAAWSATSATGLTEVHGDLGSIRLDRGEAVLHTSDRTEVLENTDADELGFTPIFRRFADAVRGDAPPLHTLAEGRRNLQLVFAGYDSAIDNQVVHVKN